MRVASRLGTLLGLALCAASAVHAATQDIREVADTALTDIANARYVPGEGAVITYNPRLCRQAGAALCAFYRAHEYAHVVLGHIYDYTDPWEAEAEADRWAAAHASPAAVRAAYRYFLSGGGGTPVHGSGRMRAARLYPFLTESPAPGYPWRTEGGWLASSSCTAAGSGSAGCAGAAGAAAFPAAASR